ncbi:MAG: ABC-F family ATP-binding cassette domain-containing protein [Oscillospiraceae bacterium]|nr:ABC-F family ATP-binding cassette domain-containing protein [Oscillospiraceae bacterium]
MLEIKDLTLTLRSDGRELVRDFSFTLHPGDRAVLIGEEGNGKSTLLQYLADPARVEAYCEASGRVLCRGSIGYLPQLPPPALAGVPVCTLFEDTEWYEHTGTLAALGIPPELLADTRPFGSFSGGEKVRLQLAALLMHRPDILLLDEPTNDLDIDTLRWMERFLLGCRLPVLYISHDETLIERTANVILHMEQLIRKTQCRITVTRAPYREYLARRAAGFEKQEQVAQKQRDDHAKQMARWQQIHDKVEHQQATITRQDPGGARLLKKKMHAVLSTGRRLERQAEDFEDFPEYEEAILTRFPADIRLAKGKVVLDLFLERLTVDEGTPRLLAENIRLFAAGGVHIGITGANGAGKSTLLEHIRRQLAPRRDITTGWMPQNYAAVLDIHKSAVEHLAARYTKAQITAARTHLGSMKFTHREMLCPIGQLSGGQRAKLIFLQMVLDRADVLLLDEPTRNFSPLSAPVVRSALREFGGCIISVSHDRRYLRQVCDEVYELKKDGLHRIVLPAEEDFGNG